MLRFPNPCRSFDADKGCIAFWGYDSAIEVSFYIDTNILKRLRPETEDLESGYLNAFDAELEHIHKMANKAYMRAGAGSYAHRLKVEDI